MLFLKRKQTNTNLFQLAVIFYWLQKELKLSLLSKLLPLPVVHGRVFFPRFRECISLMKFQYFPIILWFFVTFVMFVSSRPSIKISPIFTKSKNLFQTIQWLNVRQLIHAIHHHADQVPSVVHKIQTQSAHVYQITLAVRQIVVPNVLWMPIVQHRWPAFAINARIHVMALVHQTPIALFYIIEHIVCATMDIQAIHTLVAHHLFSVRNSFVNWSHLLNMILTVLFAL